MEEDNSAKPNPAWRIALVGGPAFLVLSSAVALWIWARQLEDPAPDPRLALAASEVRVEELDDHLRKLDELIGSRDWETPEGRRALRQTLAFLEGTLSPQNYGFVPEKGAYVELLGELWPTLWVDLGGAAAPEQLVLVAVPYDRSSGVLAATLGAINDLRDEELGPLVRFAFYPAVLFEREGREGFQELVREGETRAKLLEPQLPEGLVAEGGEDVEPVAQALIVKVRSLAGETRKMP